ncbi:uncharacterized protein LOC135961535 [Calliphora vicina]|uniref:uncharacterized protein LOC135961535 n=1 Tax=Calliphora vicina TaxID=7373 RepID=UPI00325AC87C
MENSYDSVIVAVQPHFLKDEKLQKVFEIKEPKIIVDKNFNSFYFKRHFNSEIMAVIIMEHNFDLQLWSSLSNTLNFMRQIRILIICVNVSNNKQLQSDVLRACEQYHQNNVILHLLNTSQDTISQEYWQLKPFPNYHFQNRMFDNKNIVLYPKHWHDMKGKTLLTLPDQIQPRSFLWKNDKNQLQLSGFTAKCVQLFADKYNATLKMSLPLKVNEIIHLSIITNMTQQGQLDIPMSLDSSFTGDKWLFMSYPLEIGKWMIMSPCAETIETNQVFKLLFTPQLFAIISTFSILFSLLLSLIEKLFHNHSNCLNIFISDKVIPGILAQSFVLHKSSNYSMRIVYVLIFIFGLMMSTNFSAHLKTLITSPPLQKQPKTFDEFRAAGKKILLDILDKKNLDNYIMEKMEGAIKYTHNTTLFQKYRQNFNTTYSYAVTAGLWNIFTKKQEFLTHKIFCSSENMFIMDLLMLGIPLQKHSMYKEPLDQLIHRIHSVGLFSVWQSQTFYDMMRLGNITIKDTSKIRFHKDLSENDLLFVWFILLLGLSSSCIIFLLEVLGTLVMKMFKNKCKYKYNT